MKWISLREVYMVVVALMAVIFGIAMLSEASKKKALMDGDALDINTVLIEDVIENIVLEGDLNSNFGSFAEEYKTKNGVKHSDSKYMYLVVVGDEFIGVQIKGDDVFEQMEQQANDSFAYVNNETPTTPQKIYIRGLVKRMDSEYYQYMKEYMISMGFTNEEVNAYAYPYYIDTCYYEEWQRAFGYGILCVSLGAAVIIIIIASVRLKKSRAERAQEGILQSSSSYTSFAPYQSSTVNDDIEKCEDTIFENEH